MPTSPCYFFKNAFEFVPKEEIDRVPNRVRGIYVLYIKDDNQKNVVYIGMARGEKSGAKGRLKQHRKSKTKFWTHFSIFQVWDNISPSQVVELEGLFRHIYRFDAAANKLNKQKTYKPLQAVVRKSDADWIPDFPH